MTDVTRALEALRNLAMPVVVVSTRDNAGPCGATATAMYTSLDPVEIVVALTATSRTAQAVLSTRELSVSLLSSGQGEIAVRAAKHGDAADKFADVGIKTVTMAPWSAPAVAGTTAFWGRVVATVPTGDHTLIVVRVEEVLLPQSTKTPGALIRYQRTYTAVTPATHPVDERYPL
jgi:flavin reductase (DIM6/NTAB) family NADH-FMN oxidoreductase RutF